MGCHKFLNNHELEEVSFGHKCLMVAKFVLLKLLVLGSHRLQPVKFAYK